MQSKKPAPTILCHFIPDGPTTTLAGGITANGGQSCKAAAAIRPLQYQKSLRLRRARRLLIAKQDASRAGHTVGYESASQFSREYAKLFGASPAPDNVRLCGDGAALAAIASAA